MTVTVEKDSLTLQEVKDHLTIGFDLDDALLQTYIDASVDYIQAFTGRSIFKTSYQTTDLPTDDNKYVYVATKPNSIKLTWNGTATGSTVQFSHAFSSSFAVSNGSVAAMHEIAYAETLDYIKWVPAQANTYDSTEQNVQIDFKAVLEKAVSIYDPDAVAKTCSITLIDDPKQGRLLRQCRLLLIGEWYENRADTQYYRSNSIPHGIKSMLDMLTSSSI